MDLLLEMIQNSDIKDTVINELMNHKEIKENYDIIYNTNIGLCFINKKCPLFISFFFPEDCVVYIIRFIESISEDNNINLYSYGVKNILSLYNGYTFDSPLSKIMNIIFSIFIEYEGYDVKYEFKSDPSYTTHHYKMTYVNSIMNGFFKHYTSKISPNDCIKIKDILIEKKNYETFNVFDISTNIFQLNNYSDA